jgi:hypothetical protein
MFMQQSKVVYAVNLNSGRLLSVKPGTGSVKRGMPAAFFYRQCIFFIVLPLQFIFLLL